MARRSLSCRVCPIKRKCIHGYGAEKVVHRDTVRAVSCISNDPMGEVIERIEEIVVSSVRLQNYSKLSRVNTRS